MRPLLFPEFRIGKKACEDSRRLFIGMICQIYIVPALFVFFQSLQEKFRPMHFTGLVSGEGDSELKQYTHPMKSSKETKA